MATPQEAGPTPPTADAAGSGSAAGSADLRGKRIIVGITGGMEIVIIGTIHGNVEASEKLEIRKEAKLVGDIRTARIVIEDGAYFKGSIDIIKQDVGKQEKAQPRPQQATAAAAGASASSSATPAPVAELKR